MCKRRYTQELAHMAMEAKGSHDLSSLPTGNPGKPVVQFQGRRAGGLRVQGKEMDVPAQHSGRLQIPPSSNFLFCVDLPQVDDTHSPWGGPSALPTAPTHMLVSSRNALTNTPRNNAQPHIWASCDPVELTHSFNQHTMDCVEQMTEVR